MLVGISKLKLDSGDEHDEECFDSAPPLAPGLAPGLAPASLLLDMATLVGAFKAATGWTGSAVKLCGMIGRYVGLVICEFNLGLSLLMLLNVAGRRRSHVVQSSYLRTWYR